MSNRREFAPRHLNIMENSRFHDESDHQKLESASALAAIAGPHAAPSPAAAMSLRTRESSALALKHIFDEMQRNRAGGDAWGEAEGSRLVRESTRGRGFQALRNYSMPNLRTSAMTEQGVELTLYKPFPQHTTLSSLASQQQSASCPNLVQKISRIPSSPTKQPTAQLTIFYSGIVNVYSDVPADKAQAIMLLAGTGNFCSANCQSRFSSAETLNISTEATASHVARCGELETTLASQETVPSNTCGTGMIAKPSGVAPVPMQSLISSVPSSPLVAVVSDPPKLQLPLKRLHTGIELPYARKASLARFLEKRKDRVQMKQENQATKQGTGDTLTEKSMGQEKDNDICTRSHVSFQEGLKNALS